MAMRYLGISTQGGLDRRCAWELPALGAVAALGAALIRPDGCVAWVGDPVPTRLADALTTWFGPPAAAQR